MLRDYQLRGVEDVRAAFTTARRVVYVLPTGGGKTAIACEVMNRAVANGRRVLFLAHRRELVQQTARRIDAGVIMAGVAPSASQIQVASIDTLTARGELPPADLIIVDEAHHVTAESWRDLLSKYARAHVLGLTATPERSDGVALGHIFERLVSGPTVSQMVADGWLVDCDVIAPDQERNHLACEPVAAWRQWARRGDAGFVFCRTVEQSKAIAREFCQNGIPASHVDGETNHIARSNAVRGFEHGLTNVLCSVYVFTEGVDLPRARVCMLARGCGSAGTFLQMVGRVLRPYPTKDRALLLDLVGAVHAHGLPTDPRTYSLEGKAIAGLEKLPALAQCTECGAVWRSNATRECPRCGYELPEPEAPRVLESKMDDIRKSLRPNATDAEKRSTMQQLRARAISMGKTGTSMHAWAAVQFRIQFGHYPRKL